MDAASKVKLEINDIVKSPGDNRLYRGLEFHNGLKALLISDSTTDKSSAALDVHIGHMSDPDDLPGLAHFCEHMLFLGTEKYPEENSYSKFLSEHGGSSNAFTSSEHTNYYFDVSPDNLADALDRFAQFFICPLFTESATSREVNAVNSENDKNLQNDSWRIHQLDRSTCNPKHAFSKFGTGNIETLETIPKQKNQDVRQELLKFHERYYSSNLMCLSVLGKESLDELSEMVTKLFSDVKNKNLEVPEWNDHPCGPDEVKCMVSVAPIKDLRNLNVVWPIPDLHPYYKSNPGHYLGHLIGHEGPGSLLSELKKRGWVNTLVAGQHPGAKGFMFFGVNVDLSEEGIEHIEDIVTLIFQYLNLLRKEGPKDWIFKECQDLSSMAFRFKDKERPSNYTCHCSSSLQDYPMKEVLCGSYLHEEYNAELINMVLDKLTPETLRICVVGKKFEDKTDLIEKWYGTNYTMQKLSDEIIKNWKNAGLNNSFHLPEKNEFIPTNFDLYKQDEDASSVPVILKESKMTRLWYKQDDKFKLPKVCFTVQLTSPFSYLDPLSANMTLIFTELLKDSLNEYAYAAELAGLAYNLNSNHYGLMLNLQGYNDKQHILLQKVLDKMTSLEIDPQRFNILLENYVRGLKNFRAEQPHQHAIYYTNMLVAEQQWTKEELLDATDDMTIEKLKTFIPQLFSQLYLEALAYGNITREKANQLVDIIEGTFAQKCHTRPLLASQRRRFREVQLPDGCCYQYCQQNDVHKSSSLEVYYQCNIQETHSNMVLELFCQIISEPCFDILRTQEQLGYIVFSGVRRSNGVQGLRVIVQSDKSPAYVEKRVEVFLQKMKDYIKDMEGDVFDKHVQALATKRLEKPKKLLAQHNRYWSEISTQYFNFERDEIEVGHLRNITKEDVLKFYQELLAYDAPKRHKLSVHIVSNATLPTSVSSDNDAITTEEVVNDNPVDDSIDGLPALQWTPVTDIITFKRQLGLFPLPEPFINVATMNMSKL